MQCFKKENVCLIVQSECLVISIFPVYRIDCVGCFASKEFKAYQKLCTQNTMTIDNAQTSFLPGQVLIKEQVQVALINKLQSSYLIDDVVCFVKHANMYR